MKDKDWKMTLECINETKLILETWKGFADRNVKDIYESNVDDDVTIILFEGYEQGEYWDREEYDKANGLV